MVRHSLLNRLAINAIATEPITECRDYPHSASSTTKLQQCQYGMMTQRRRQRLNRLGTTVDYSTVTFAIRHSSTRHSSSTHCQRRYNSVDATPRSVEPPSVPGRPLFDRLVPIMYLRITRHSRMSQRNAYHTASYYNRIAA